MSHQGYRQVGDTLNFKFSTQTSAGVPTTLAGSPVIKIYRSNDTTTEQTTGLTLTVDFDGVTGLNNVTVVTTASSFYTADTDFSVIITNGTVGGQSVAGAVVGEFRLISVRVDGSLDSGTAAAIANGTITLRSGHGLASVGSVLILLTGGTDAVGKSRLATYSGLGDVFNVDPAWNTAGESLPSGTITYRVYAAPPAPTSTVPAVNLTQVNGSSYVEGSTLTPIKWLRLMGASLFGKASGMGTTTAVLRDTTDTTNRITATVDADGNRTAVTLDAS